MFLAILLDDKKIWWEAPNAVRIPTAIVVVLVLSLRIYGVYRTSKNAPKRSPKVRRIQRIVAISLWSFIAVATALLLIFKR
jgi:hypothetical protein